MKRTLSRILAVMCAAIMVFAITAYAEPEDAASEVTGDHVLIRVASFAAEGNFMAEQLLKVCQYVEEHSNGTIEFEYYLGGTYCNMIEEFSNLSAGSIDMCSLMEGGGQAVQMLSLFQFARAADSVQDSVQVCDYLLNEDPETSPMLLGQMAEMGIIALGYSIAGLDAYCATSPITSYADMASLTFGCDRNQAFFEALGLNVISVEMQDIYESLSRGLIQATSQPVSNISAQKFFEVAPNVLVAKVGGAAGIVSMNLDKWNSLSESQQQCFRDGYEYARQWAADEYDNILAADVSNIEAGGGTVAYLSDEDNALLKDVSFQSQWDSTHGIAEAQGLGDQYATIFQKAAEMVGSSFTIEK